MLDLLPLTRSDHAGVQCIKAAAGEVEGEKCIGGQCKVELDGQNYKSISGEKQDAPTTEQVLQRVGIYPHILLACVKPHNTTKLILRHRIADQGIHKKAGRRLSQAPPSCSRNCGHGICGENSSGFYNSPDYGLLSCCFVFAFFFG